MLSHTDNISSMSYELLRSMERGKSFKEASLVDPFHPVRRRGRKIYSASRVIDHAYQARLAVCIGDKELRISSALSGALRDLDSTATTTTSRPSRISTDQKGGLKEERVDQKIVDREVVTAPCNLEAVVPEKKGGDVVEKKNHLAICAPPTAENRFPSNTSLPLSQ